MDWIAFSAIVGIAGFILTVGSFFGLNWRTVRYRALRFSEYPQITPETPPNAAVIFAVHTAMATACTFVIGVAFLGMATNLLFHPETPYRVITIVEMLIASAMVLWSAYRAGSALDRAYRKFFPEKMLDEQLQRRGHLLPDELKERRKAR
ncbi:MAG TPA: hypothetical protein VGU66_08960 [Candidatus Elarobacter sp.]|nr:hypothetical protein [Candidatus Elarobacter sp.]